MRKGSELESLIRRVSQKLAEAQVMRLFKWPVDQIIQERAIRCTSCGAFSNGLSLLHTHRTGCDFFGYTSRGQHVALEAKGIAKPSLRIYCEEGAGVHIHQMLHLEEVARAGGKAVIVWRNDTGITAMEIRAAIGLAKGRKSIPWTGVPLYAADEDNLYKAILSACA